MSKVQSLGTYIYIYIYILSLAGNFTISLMPKTHLYYVYNDYICYQYTYKVCRQLFCSNPCQDHQGIQNVTEDRHSLLHAVSITKYE